MVEERDERLASEVVANMFWQLAEDAYENGLLEVIDRVLKK